MCGDWGAIALPDVSRVVSCIPNELVVKSTATTDKVAAAFRPAGYEAVIDLKAPAKGMQLRNPERDKTAERPVGILVSRTADGYALKRDFGDEGVWFPYAVHETQGPYEKVKAAVTAHHAALGKLLDSPAARSAPTRCASAVKLDPKLKVLALDVVNKGSSNEGYNLGMADDPYAEKTARTLLQRLTETPVEAVYVTRSERSPDVMRGISGELVTEVAIADAVAGTVLCHTTVTSHNSATVKYTVETKASGARSDDSNLNASIDLSKNRAKDVGDAVKRLLDPSAKP